MSGLRCALRLRVRSISGAKPVGSSTRYVVSGLLLGLVCSTVLACGSDPASSGSNDDRDERRATRRAAADAGQPPGGSPVTTGPAGSEPEARTYVPTVIGTKVFAARGSEDIEAYFSARGGRALDSDSLFDEVEEHFARVPQGAPVFGPNTPAIISVVLFDCRPTGNIRLAGTTRLIDETVPGDPFIMYERPFSIDRRQTADGFTISTSSGRGCMDNLNAGMPRDGWPPGPYRVEYRDSSGDLLVAIPFEVSQPTSSRIDGSYGIHRNGTTSTGATTDAPHGEAPELWIDVSLAPFRPGAQVEVISNVDIEPGDLLVTLHLEERGLLGGIDLRNQNRITGGAGFQSMDFDWFTSPIQGQWHATTLDGVSASLRGEGLGCQYDAGASDRRRQHSFDDREVYFCTPGAGASGDATPDGGLIPSGEHVFVTPGGEVITILQGGESKHPMPPTPTPMSAGR